MRCLRPLTFALLALLARIAWPGGLTDCAHGDAFDGAVLRKGDVRVHVAAVPGGWRRVALDGADLAFRDDARAGSALFDVRCGQRDDDAPLSTLTEHLIMGTTDRAVASQEVVPYDGRETMHTVLGAKLDGVAMQYDLFVMKKDGCLFDFVYVAPPNLFAEGAAEFEHFVAGVHATSSRVEAESVSRPGAQ